MADMLFVKNDGGRAGAGYKGASGDCVARAIAIASRRPYQEVYDRLARETGNQRAGKHSGKRAARADRGINTARSWFKKFMTELGFRWVPTMQIGSGCKVHLQEGELPMGRLVVAVSKHYTAVIDGKIHDTHNPQRTTIIGPETARQVSHRCVYGYWIMEGP